MKKRDNEEIDSFASDQSSYFSNVSKSKALLSITHLKKYLFICSFAFMMNYAAYGGLVFLQSSMNIEDGLGTASLFVIYVTSSLSTILLIPFLIDFLGAKAAIVLGEIGIIAFTAANFYPSWYTMLPVAIFHGVTESASWAGAAVYVTHLGEQYWHLRSKKTTKSMNKREDYVYRFISVFYVFVYLAQVIGNSLVYFVLHSFKDIDENRKSLLQPSGNSTQFVFVENASFTENKTEELSSCGAQECQMEFIYNSKSEKLDKYKPNQLSVYLLLAIFLAMQAAFTLVHAFAIPRIPSKIDREKENVEMISSRDDLEPVLRTYSRHSNHVCSVVWTELKLTFSHIVSPLHLLIFPIIIYYGIFIAFNVTEFTRAYVSCIIGVEQVGLVMVVYGLSSMIVSLLSTKILPLLGRNVVFLIVVLMHLFVYLLCLQWKPSFAQTWMVYLIAGCLGSCDGMSTNLIQVMIAVYFEEKLGIAFSVKNLATNLGIVAGTGISTLLCIYTKLHILISLLSVSTLLYAGAEILFRRKKQSATSGV